MDADALSSSSTVMDLSGGIFYDSFEEVTMMAARDRTYSMVKVASFGSC